MRRLKLLLGIAGLIALLTAGVAVAKHKNGGPHTDSVAATFTATQSSVRERTCTGTDGQYRQFHAAWSGTSTGDPRLSGTLRLKAHGLVNATTQRGQVKGWVHIRSANGKLAHGKLLAVYRDSKLHGVVVGRVKDRSTGAAEELSGSGRLIALVEITLAGAQATGRIGGDGATILPAVIQQGGCGDRNGDDDDDNGDRKRKGRR
jgi:hypothetical protein